MRVLIFEQNYQGGHFLAYVAHAVRGLREIADDIVIGLPAGAESSPQYQTYLGPLEGTFRVQVIPARGDGNAFSQLRTRARAIRAAIDAVRPDAFYILTGDGYHEAVALSRLAGFNAIPAGVYCETLLLRNPYAYGMHDRRFPRWLTKLALRVSPWNRIHFIDPVVFSWVQRELGPATVARCRYTPEPIDKVGECDRLESRAALGIPGDGRVISTVGMQCGRKGTDLLLEAFERACELGLGASDRLLIAGPQTPEITALLESRYRRLMEQKRIVAINRYLTPHDQCLVFAASDLVACPYRPAPQPSAVCLQAAAAGRMVLTTDTAWFAHVVERYGLGVTCDVSVTPRFAEAIVQTLDRAGAHSPNERARELLASHEPRRFADAIRQGLGEHAAATGRSRAS